ncbi:MAG: fasciclin domain-containing protein [Lutibacter sp.]|jgi:uncharacterized surface protein with fasciclin (FAS1) repeats|nr:fasciclin domain-containing protein [Lutibacter sp.]
MKNIIRTCSLLALLALFAVSCNGGAGKQESTVPTAPLGKGQSAVQDDESAANALQVAKSLEDFSTLVVAIEAAGVEDALVNAGPLTVFAPINAAFEKLPAGTVESLVKPENKAKLAFILKNHVAPANFPIKQLKKDARKGRKLYMASGNYLEVEHREDAIYVGGVKILKTVQVSNGWIHVIDTILLPTE